MTFVDLIARNKLVEAKSFIFERLEQMVATRLQAEKVSVAADIYEGVEEELDEANVCLLYTSPSPRDKRQSRMPSSA